ncbi:MAG: hydrogenase maturation nickel metallochaperone HypA [Bacteroidetes bacterium]|nr:hydrogenase maturation nickel metallochaperone HypA [Bacteroidota bacterium]
MCCYIIAMHELSIAHNVAEIVSKAVKTDDLSRVLKIKMKIGAMAGVVPESLDFSFKAITAGTSLANTKLVIEYIPFRIRCEKCGVITEMESGVIECPQCGSSSTQIISGQELLVTEIELEDD